MPTDFGLSNDITERIKAIFRHYPEIDRVVIYGSRAKGVSKTASDIDLTIQGKMISTSTLNRISMELDDLMLPYTFDISIYEHISNQDLLEHIDRVGKEFYKQSQ